MSKGHDRLKLAAVVALSPPLPRLTLDAGDRLLRDGGLRALRAALQGLLDPPLPEVLHALPGDDGWTLFWLGFVNQFDAPLAATAAWHAAQPRFEAAGDARGLDLIACGLLQAMVIDNQSHHDIDEVLARVRRTPASVDDTGPLALYCAAARLLVAGQSVDGRGAHERDVERVFTALSGSFDAELRLQCAASAMNGVGRSMDHVHAADFHEAGAAVAALPEVGPTTRLRWQVLVSTARWHDASAVPRLAADLEAAERQGPPSTAHHLIAWSRAIRAMHAISAGHVDEARGHLEVAHRFLEPAYPLDYALFHFVSARLALRRHELESAATHVTMSLRKNKEGGDPVGDLTPILSLSGAVHAALGEFDDAATHFARAADLSGGAQKVLPLCHLHLTRGVQLFRAGAHAEARAELDAGFAQARSIDYTTYFGVLPGFAAEVCGAALELDLDRAYVGRTVAARALVCPDVGIAAWPRSLSVRALGGFLIERHGEPVKFGRKAPKRLLDVLRLVVVLGGRQVDAGRVVSALWPDSDGDEGRMSLKAMLHRARSLLGIDPLVVREGQISFDAEAVWLDTWAFEHVVGRIESLLPAGAATEQADDGELARRRLQLMTLYRGNLFGEGDVPPWALPTRDRLRARFVRATDLLGQRLERRGRHDEAIALYRAALEQDNLAEELYQRLIECHLARGEQAQALNAYRRCRELLSIVLGLKPSARTEALANRIANR